MAGRGPAPKSARLRQRTNKKSGATVLPMRSSAASIPKLADRPDGRAWHPKTLAAWREFFESPMAEAWLQTDITGLEMVAALYDEFYKTGDIEYMKEIRLQRPCYGLTPLDRSRLQWEIARGDEADGRRQRRPQKKAAAGRKDPRGFLVALK